MILTATAGVAHAEPTLGINVLGDVAFSLEDDSGGLENSFAAGHIELFLTSNIDRVEFLSEILLETLEGANSFALDVERIEIGYLFNEYLRVRVGRFHTSLGYYSDTYHHGGYFLPSVERPFTVNFEDDGGLIPAHSVGLHADGRLPVGDIVDIRYDIDFVNGRGPIPDEITNAFDFNDHKAFNARLRFEPPAVDGLIIGFNGYFDRIERSSEGAAESLDERIWGAHLVYEDDLLHLIAEGYLFDHRPVSGASNFLTKAGFIEGGVLIETIMPYVRVERISFPNGGDPFFSLGGTGAAGSLSAFTFGTRWIASENVVFKAEFVHARYDLEPDTDVATAQCAFTF